MIGKYQIQLGAEQFISGMSSTDYATDGALGNSSNRINPFATPGIIQGTTISNDINTNIVGNFIASAEDSQTTAAYNRTFIDDAGNYYGFTNPLTVTKLNTATTNAAFYTTAVTDMVSFALNTYVTTSNGDIDRWNTSVPTLTNSWWVGTKGQTLMTTGVPHPMIAYQGNLYIADKNKLNTVASDSSTIALAVLTLNTNEIIYAMGIDPTTGLMMLSVQTTMNISVGLSSRFFIYLYDGISAKPLRKIPTDDLVTGFQNVEGIVYVGYGQSIGMWNGNGITFLRRLLNANLTSTDLPYKHHLANYRNILFVIDGPILLAYGSPVGGAKRAWFNFCSSLGLVDHLTCVAFTGGTNIAISNFFTVGTVYNFRTVSITATTGDCTLDFNNIYFPRPIYVRRMRIFTTGMTTTAGAGAVSILDENNVRHTTTVSTFVVTAAQSPREVFDFDYSSLKVQAIQPSIDQGGLAGIVRVIIYYDIAE